MKKSKHFFTFSTILFIGLLISTCQQADDMALTSAELCEGISCQNGGACDRGACNCPAGTSGMDCSTVYREIFLGSYTLTSNTNSVEIEAEITAIDTDQSSFYIMWGEDTNMPTDILATATSEDTFEFPEEEIQQGVFASGNGTISSAGVITLNAMTSGGLTYILTFAPR